MQTHEQWLKDVRSMNWSVAARTGAEEPLWAIRFAREAYREGKISLAERDKIFADVRVTLGVRKESE